MIIYKNRLQRAVVAARKKRAAALFSAHLHNSAAPPNMRSRERSSTHVDQRSIISKNKAILRSRSSLFLYASHCCLRITIPNGNIPIPATRRITAIPLSSAPIPPASLLTNHRSRFHSDENRAFRRRPPSLTTLSFATASHQAQ